MRPIHLLAVLALATPHRAAAQTVRTWMTGGKPVVLEPTATSMCVLTRVGGRFSGAGEMVRVVARDGRWVLEGHSMQPDLIASAHCTRLSRFASAGWARVHAVWGSRFTGGKKGACFSMENQAGRGDGATFISTFSGQYRGAGELVEVRPAASGGARSTFYAQTCRGREAGEFPVDVTTFQSGAIEPGPTPRMIGPKGVGGPGMAGEYRAGPNQTLMLARTSEAVCGLTYISGAFLGRLESVSVHSDGTRWVLRTRSASGAGTLAGARCLAFQQ